MSITLGTDLWRGREAPYPLLGSLASQPGMAAEGTRGHIPGQIRRGSHLLRGCGARAGVRACGEGQVQADSGPPSPHTLWVWIWAGRKRRRASVVLGVRTPSSRCVGEEEGL